MIAPSPSADSPIDAPPSVRSLSILTLLFVGSGAAALIYEIVWLQLLQFVVGSSAVSLGVLLGTFMGGMCLGSLLVPRWISSAVHPLRAYAALEAALVHDPYNEYLYVRIMRLQAAAGRAEAVRRTLGLLESKLTDLGLTPSSQTRQAAAALLAPGPGQQRSEPGSRPGDGQRTG